MTEGKIEYELGQLNAKISQIDMAAKTIDGWLPRNFTMKFFDLGETSMTSMENTGKLVVSKIGRRKFYCVKSIIALLKNNIVSK